MKVLLIGATGLLGHNVARQLLCQGHEVAALVRNLRSLHPDVGAAGGRLTVRVGSFVDFDTLLPAAEGCQAIVNCAGCTDMSRLRLEDYMPANRDGVRTIARVMEVHGISTLVHTSTANTIGFRPPADEATPWQRPFSDSLYAQSKRAGEEVVDALAARHPDWHIVTVHPGFMLGPYDYKPSSGQLLDAAYRRPLMLAPRGGKSFVPVGDVAAAIVNAMGSGAHGGHYLLTGQNLSLRDFYRLQARVCGYKQLILCVPDWLMLLLGRIGDGLRSLGLRTQLSTRNVRQLLVEEHYTNARASAELAMPHTALELAVRDYFAQPQFH